MKFKSRFAPSPTGFLHIGNARSAVLNWAHILNKGGEFILRIDDTDFSRSNKEFINSIHEDLTWLGIKCSYSFNQSNRLEVYEEKIEKLKNESKLYPCFESPEELSLKRKNLLSQGKPPIYDRKSLLMTNSDIQNLIKDGKKPHWRFKLEHKTIKWNDLIKGEVSFDCSKLSDPILIREDNTLLYHLPSVIDDISENITDIIRGDDHINNTAFHIQIFESLNANIPIFAHHSFLRDEMGKSFGKRFGSLSLKKLREIGYDNITILNYLLSIGAKEKISKEKNIKNLINEFNISSISKSSPKFSEEVLKNLNKEILKSYDYLEIKEKFNNLDMKNVSEDFWLFIKENIYYFNDVIEWWHIVNSKDKYILEKDEFLEIAAQLLPEEKFTINTWEVWTRKISEKTGKKGKDLFLPLRFALTGRNDGPELKFLMPLLNRNQVLIKLGL